MPLHFAVINSLFVQAAGLRLIGMEERTLNAIYTTRVDAPSWHLELEFCNRKAQGLKESFFTVALCHANVMLLSEWL